jgi:hypothetical protein
MSMLQAYVNEAKCDCETLSRLVKMFIFDSIPILFQEIKDG